MKKIEINLYPYSSSQKWWNKLFERFFPFVFFVVFFAIIINILFSILTGLVSLSLNRANKEWSKNSPQIKEIKGLKKEIETLRIKKMDLDTLSQERVDLSHLFAEIYASLPKNIWLDKISYTDGSLSLAGYAVKWKKDCLASIDSFVKQLKRKEYIASLFDNLILKDTKRMEYRGRKVTYFIVYGK